MAEDRAANLDVRRLDLSAIREAIRSGHATDAWMAGFVPATCADAIGFTREMYALARSRVLRIDAAPGRPVDFYHDCVARHLGKSKVAYLGIERGERVSLSYDALHARSTGLHASWRKSDIGPGKNVCVVLPVSSTYAAALMAGLRAGACVSVVPPLGRSFVQRRVAQLSPDIVVTTSSHLPKVEGTDKPIVLCEEGLDRAAPPLSLHDADAPALKVCTTNQKAPFAPVEVHAGALHAAMVRDALFVLALEEGEIVAMPGFDPLSCQPTALLATLLAGATWAEIDDRDSGALLEGLRDFGVNLLGVSPRTRDALLLSPSWRLGGVRAWMRSLLCPMDLSRWDALGQLSAKAGVAAFNVAFCPAAGGAVLFGPVQREPLDLQVWPPPGQAFSLGEVGTKGMPALGESGVYNALREDAAIPGVPRLMLGPNGAGHMCVGSVDLGPDGGIFPTKEVAAAIEGHPEVRHASVVVTQGRHINDARSVALAFVDDRRGPEGAIAPAVTPEEIRGIVEDEMGSRHAPSRVEIFPLAPRVRDDGVDDGWCRSQYLAGALGEKSRDELFVLLSRLVYTLDLRAAEPPGESQ